MLKMVWKLSPSMIRSVVYCKEMELQIIIN